MIYLLKPHTSEKSHQASQQFNCYTFKVDCQLNKPEIKRMIEAEYQVKVVKVTTYNQLPKLKQSIRLGKRSRYRTNVKGRRARFKKAHVTLAQGGIIPAFTDLNEAS